MTPDDPPWWPKFLVGLGLVVMAGVVHVLGFCNGVKIGRVEGAIEERRENDERDCRYRCLRDGFVPRGVEDGLCVCSDERVHVAREP